MTKITRLLLLSLSLVIVFAFTSCPAPGSASGSSDAGALVQALAGPSISIQMHSYCPTTQVVVFFNGGFGAVKTLEIYKALETGAFSKVATLTNLSGATVYYYIYGLQGKFRFYARAQRAKDNLWYTSVVWNYMTLCSGGSGSGSGGPGGSSSGSGSGGPAGSSAAPGSGAASSSVN